MLNNKNGLKDLKNKKPDLAKLPTDFSFLADLATKLQIKFMFLSFLNFFLMLKHSKEKNLWVTQQVLQKAELKKRKKDQVLNLDHSLQK